MAISVSSKQQSLLHIKLLEGFQELNKTIKEMLPPYHIEYP